MSAQPSEAKRIFLDAVENLAPEQWPEFLDEACDGDSALRNHAEALLKAHGESNPMLDGTGMLPGMPLPPVTEGPGTIIGRYKLLELIGEGGFGNVYLAEQTEPVRRKVALKIIKLGMDTRAVIARFEAERQALALMDHPNIAKIHDAGATETGRPYFVMDLVRGFPITEYCDTNNVTTQERLSLFIDVCQAVQHAHQKGIIHRDIKPTNVMVTLQDTKPVPKIIDFGIAKATQQRLTEKTLFTEHRQLVGTPEYMSPEQATFGEANVDTRSDIYSLGVLLYELLVGTTPFDAEALRSHGYDEICRVIRESDTLTPSKRLSTLGDAVTDITKHRHVEPAALRKLLRGDLDWIVMKCLEKDRTRRYETAHGLARDVERHVTDEPVRARPPSVGYRLKKFVRKHRAPVAAVAGISAALILGLILATIGFVGASRERDRATDNLRLARQIISDLFAPAAIRMGSLPHSQALRQESWEQVLGFYERFLDQAGDDPAVRHEMALIYHRFAWYSFVIGKECKPAYRRSISILEKLVTDFPSDPVYRWDLAIEYAYLADSYVQDLKYTDASGHLRTELQILKNLESQFGPGHIANGESKSGPASLRMESLSKSTVRERIALCHRSLGFALDKAGELNEAEKHFREALQPHPMIDRTRRDPIWQFVAHQQFAWLLMSTGRFDEAENHLEEALTTAEEIVSSEPFDRAAEKFWLCEVHKSYGELLYCTARHKQAAQHLRTAIELGKKVCEDFPDIPWFSHQLGTLYQYLSQTLVAMDRLADAETAARQSLTQLRAAGMRISAYHAGLAHVRLGELLYGAGRTDESAEEFSQAKEAFEKTAGESPDEPHCQIRLVVLLATCPDPQFRDPQRAVQLAKRKLPKSDGQHWQYLALAQYRTGDWQDAIESAHQAMELRAGGDALDWFLLAMAHWQLGEQEQALTWYKQAEEAIESQQPILYDLIGVLGFRRVRAEAKTLLESGLEERGKVSP